MIHLAAIVLGIMILMAIGGVCYVIHSVLTHFGFDTEEIVITAIVLAIIAVAAWLFGSLALEIVGIL